MLAISAVITSRQSLGTTTPWAFYFTKSSGTISDIQNLVIACVFCFLEVAIRLWQPLTWKPMPHDRKWSLKYAMNNNQMNQCDTTVTCQVSDSDRMGKDAEAHW